ncbi:hypothetical protein BDR03DRAFT_949554 [Suillus americanus]|nr:hypothetical protein BDR03DRAFT_949554 [Suillus americanus]
MALLEVFSIHKTPNQSTLAEDRMLPATLRDTSILTGVLCLFALGRPDLEAHWESLQSKEAFKNVRERLCSILTITITAAGLLLATSGVFVTTASPVPYFDYTLPAPYFLLFISLMMAMIAMLTSGLSIIRWLHADRQYTQEANRAGRLFPLDLPLINGHAHVLCWLCP